MHAIKLVMLLGIALIRLLKNLQLQSIHLLVVLLLLIKMSMRRNFLLLQDTIPSQVISSASEVAHTTAVASSQPIVSSISIPVSSADTNTVFSVSQPVIATGLLTENISAPVSESTHNNSEDILNEPVLPIQDFVKTDSLSSSASGVPVSSASQNQEPVNMSIKKRSHDQFADDDTSHHQSTIDDAKINKKTKTDAKGNSLGHIFIQEVVDVDSTFLQSAPGDPARSMDVDGKLLLSTPEDPPQPPIPADPPELHME